MTQHREVGRPHILKLIRRHLAVATCQLLTVVTASGAALQFGAVDDNRLRDAAAEPGEWFTGGRDIQGSYYSPLDQINSNNVTRLGFAWEYRLGTHRGLEATPIVVDGVMYTSGFTGMVYALDARTGHKIWTFDPENNLQYMRYPCCDAVNRGVALKNGLIYVASLDGRLFALDAATGQTRWSVDTIVDRKFSYTSTGAPQLTHDLVIIGNSGADREFGGLRGYVTAYDLKTGALRWRFYTVPALNEKNPTPEMVAAEKTWDPRRDPRIHGGGTVWDGMAYDPNLNLVYIGTGNAAPYEQSNRDPSGETLDNLYAASIVAIDATTGRMAWHYQTTPGDSWDFDAVQKFILADLTINGAARKVIMQANKNGYFYVIDRKTGKVVSAAPFSTQNWSKGMDANFRPIISPQVDYSREAKLVFPSFDGAHSWQPMSYSPKTGLVYIPVFDAPMLIADLKRTPSPFKWTDSNFGAYINIPNVEYDPKADEPAFGKMPKFDVINRKTGQSITRALLKAWNPVTQKTVWEQPVSQGYEVIEGGVTSTAGNLIFQGNTHGELRVFAADTGKLLHTIQTGTAIMAAPTVYMIDGVQYVAVMAGYGGVDVGFEPPPDSAVARYDNEGRILAFRLGGAHDVPRTAKRVIPSLHVPPPKEGSAADVAEGASLFNVWCSRCHGYGAVLIPDLRRMQDGIDKIDTFKQIVLGGAFAAGGMEPFNDVLKPHDVEQIHAYLVGEAHDLYATERANKR